MKISKFWGLPVLVSFSVRSILFVGVVEGRRALIFESVSVDHLLISYLTDHEDVGHKGNYNPVPEVAFLSEMLRMECFGLEI